MTRPQMKRPSSSPPRGSGTRWLAAGLVAAGALGWCSLSLLRSLGDTRSDRAPLASTAAAVAAAGPAAHAPTVGAHGSADPAVSMPDVPPWQATASNTPPPPPHHVPAWQVHPPAPPSEAVPLPPPPPDPRGHTPPLDNPNGVDGERGPRASPER